MSVSYIEPAELALLIQSGSTNEYIIVDVRDEDFDGGNIVGAVNAPSDYWEDDGFLDKLIVDLAVDASKTIVFHCMKSQMRGPKCARAFADRMYRIPASGRPKM